MKKNLIKTFSLCFIVLFPALQISAQNTFEVLYGNMQFSPSGYNARQTSNGGYIITGDAYKGNSYNNVYLLKTGNDGSVQWFKIYKLSEEGSSQSGIASCIKQTADNGYIIAGKTASGSSGSGDALVIKTDSEGNIQWHKTFGGNKVDAANAILQASTGEYIVVGSTASFGLGEYNFTNMYVLKLTANGDTIWTRTYNYLPGENDNNEAHALAVQESADGNFIIGGTSFDDSSEHQNISLFKINSANGEVIWSNSYGATEEDETASDVKITADGGYIIAGYTKGSPTDGLLLKIDATGNTIQWVKTFATANPNNSEYFTSVATTNDGGYAVYGYFSGFSDLYEVLIKTDNAGNITWSKKYGSGIYNYASTAEQTNDGGFLLCASEIGEYFDGTTAHITKTDLNGVTPCGDSSINVLINSPAFVVAPGVVAMNGGGSNGTQTITVFDEVMPANVLCKDSISNMEFVFFKGTNMPRKNILNWKTLSELKGDYYKIQRSKDKKNFTDIGRVNATLKSNPNFTYKFMDDKMSGGMNYYRIKAVHANENKTFSKIISLKTNNSSLISITNTNVSGIFLVRSEEHYNAPYLEYNIFSSTGNVVYKGRIENAYGKINNTINLSFLKAGTYYVSINSKENITHNTIVITR